MRKTEWIRLTWIFLDDCSTLTELPETMIRQSVDKGHRVFRGHPDCQAIHDHVLDWLTRAGTSTWLSGALDTRTEGNLGETISFLVAKKFKYEHLYCFAANAWQPFQGISKSDVDVVWIFFGAKTADDFVVLQEVKTTTQSSLGYANELKADYDKLFARDPRSTLQTRLGAVAQNFKYGAKRPDLCRRVVAMASRATKPARATKIKLLPTLVHDVSSVSADGVMTAIRTYLTDDGWGDVESWSIGLCNLARRLARISKGQK